MKRDANLFVYNSRQLLTLRHPVPGPRRGVALRDLGLVENGALAANDGRIVAVGSVAEVAESIAPTPDCVEVDAGGAVVLPGFVDCHTHVVFAAYRLGEYEKRVLGVPYEEIAASGGGISKSVADLRQMDEETLYEISRERVRGCLEFGSTTIEMKSGYGLDLENELKQLRVIRRLSESVPAVVVATFLGAHALPAEFADRRDEFVALIINDMIPAVVEEGLAEFIDVFSEIGVFTVGEAERILRAGLEAGLSARIHADELNDTGSGEMAARIGAVSADHLTKMSPTGISRLAASETIGVLLPGTSFGLPSTDFAPARRMVDEGVAIALASDFNPGSSPSESMPMMIAIACSHMGLSPAEAIAASTYNASFVLRRQDVVGSLEVGKRADFLLLHGDDYREIPYRFGTNPVDRVFVAGREWRGRPSPRLES